LTKNDPNPLTLIEASYAGLPIITTRFAGNCNELVFEGENGFVLDEIEFQSFSDAVTKLNTLLNVRDASEISTQNVICNFDVFNVATSLIEQFQSSFTYEKKAHK
jgi:glycosyltransferase involved in cell wall biosynthesis